MTPPRWLPASLLLVAPWPAALRADEPAIRTAHDIVYARAGDRELKLDLAEPAGGDGPFPAVLVIHGGGWRAGDKADSRPQLDELARRGYVAISPEYRFAPGDAYPAQIHDVKAAVRWLRTNARERRVDGGRIGAMGGSAGGHLSLLLGATGPADGLEGDAGGDAPGSRVQAVVNFFGPTDLAADDFPDLVKVMIRDLLGGPVAEKADLARRASPVAFVTPDDPPTLTFQGTKDPLVPHNQAYKLADAQTKAGVPGRVELLFGAGHGWKGEELTRTLDETYAFFDRHLKAR